MRSLNISILIFSRSNSEINCVLLSCMRLSKGARGVFRMLCYLIDSDSGWNCPTQVLRGDGRGKAISWLGRKTNWSHLNVKINKEAKKTVKLFLCVGNHFANGNCHIFCLRDCYGVAKQFCRLRQKLIIIKPYSPKELCDLAFAWLVQPWFCCCIQFPGYLVIFHFFEKRALNLYNLFRVSSLS